MESRGYMSSTSTAIHNRTVVRQGRTTRFVEGVARSISMEEMCNLPTLLLFVTNGFIGFVPFWAQIHALKAAVVYFWLSTFLFFLANRTKIQWNLWTCRFAFLYLVVVVSSVAWTRAPLTTVYSPVISAVGIFLYYNYISARFRPAEFLRMLVWVYTFLLFISIPMVYLLPRSYGWDILNNSDTWRGAWGQKNQLGFACACALGLCFGWKPRSNFERVWKWCLVAVSLVCLVRSGSRESWISAAVLFLLAPIIFVLRHLNQRSRIPFLLISGMIVGTTAALVYFNLDAILYLMGRDRTLTGRSGIWEGVFLMIKRHPWLGYGAYGVWGTSQAMDVYVREGQLITSSHNTYLETILDYGIIGLLCYLPIPIMAFRRTLRALVSYDISTLQVYIYLNIVMFITSFVGTILTYSPGISLLLMFYAVSELEKVERSGFMTLETTLPS